MQQIIHDLKKYEPKNAQEVADKKLILAYLAHNNDALLRTNLAAHLTVSAFIFDETFKHVVFGYHKIYNSFGWLGGHADGNSDLKAVALKEAREETSLTSLRLYSEEIFIIDVVYVENHLKNAEYVSDHLHLNITYLLIADKDEQPKRNPREHHDVKWFTVKESLDYVNESRMMPVYKKAYANLPK